LSYGVVTLRYGVVTLSYGVPTLRFRGACSGGRSYTAGAGIAED
jgi:hypothetical protein